MKNKKGMSLIVLVITILVMIILAGVVIVSLSDNNPIKKASDAKEKSNYAEYANELELYHTNHTATTPGYSKDNLNITDPNEMKKYINSMSKEDSKKYEIIQGVLHKKGELMPGEPNVSSGMTPIKWVNNLEQTTTATDPDWYNYDKQKWANAKTADGSYFVWIPRFEYKINYNDSADKSKGGEIAVNMIPVEQTTPSSGYKIHPAFTNGKANNFANGEWDKELPGIWVAKYEMSMESLVNDKWVNTQTSSRAIGNVLTSSTVRLVSKPHVSSWRYITVGNIYTNIYNYDRAKESHMMKNSEWGAVAYFTHSKYGRNQVKLDINKNSSFITGDNNIVSNVGQSSTGNITGIYDLSGSAWEYVAAYINGGDACLGTFGGSFATSKVSTKYATVYPKGTAAEEDSQGNYEALKGLLKTRYGDALVETSSKGDGEENTSFGGEGSNYPLSTDPFFLRGAHYSFGQESGIFTFNYDAGTAGEIFTGRVVLCEI